MKRIRYGIAIFLSSLPFFQKLAAQISWNALGMVDVQAIDSTIRVEIKYATTDNVMGVVLYKEINKAYLNKEIAQKLARAQRLLKAEHPNLCLLVYDAARPFSVQKYIWNLVKNTPERYYWANPEKGGGVHNYGAAVDVTLTDNHGVALPMGTAYDFLGEASHITHEEELVASGQISDTERANRLLLRRIMQSAGFTSISREWWHFDGCSRDYAQKHLPLIP